MRSDYVFPRQVANTYLVRERDRRFLRELLVVAGAIVLVALGLWGTIWTQVEVVQTGFRIGRLERELHRLRQMAKELELATAYLSSPGVVESRARSELGMEPRSLAQLVFVEDRE